jgi:DNA-binding NarL/FixJ family response regulator
VSLGQPFYGDAILQTLPAVVFGQTQAAAAELSPRECEVLALVANGHSSREIATGLGLSVRTVENHRSNIMHTLGARNTADLTREAMRLGLVAVERRRPVRRAS